MKMLKRPGQLMVIILVTVLLAGVCVSAWGQGQIRLLVDGKEIYTDVPPQIIDGRTMVPLRAVAEALGADVRWDDANGVIEIKKLKCQENPKNTCTDLIYTLQLLHSGDWVKLYARDNFDCSNMAALLDFILDNNGFNSWIVAGQTYKWLGDHPVLAGGHAMVLVFPYVADGCSVTPYWVEPTTLVQQPLDKVHPYFIPERIYLTAAQAHAANPREYTWTLEDVHRVFDTIPFPRTGN